MTNAVYRDTLTLLERLRMQPKKQTPSIYLELAEQIIHATGGDPKRKQEAAAILEAKMIERPLPVDA